MATVFAHSRTSEALRALPRGETPPLSYLSNTRSPEEGVCIHVKGEEKMVSAREIKPLSIEKVEENSNGKSTLPPFAIKSLYEVEMKKKSDDERARNEVDKLFIKLLTEQGYNQCCI